MKGLTVGASDATRGMANAPPGRESWPPLPRRSRPHRPSSVLAIRAPISRRARQTLVVLSLLVPLLAWVALSASGVVSPTFLPSPGATLAAGLEMAQSGQLLTDLWATTQRVVYGFGLAVLVSVPLGIVMGSFIAGQAGFGPPIWLVRYMPASAFVPLLLIWLGVDEAPKIAVIFLGTVFFNTMMTADVARNVPGALIDVSQTLGARRGEVLRKVIVPHSLPGIIDSIRVNAAAAWNLVVVAELVSANTGLGKRILLSQRFLDTDKIFAILIVIGLIGVTIDVALRLLRNRVGRWVA